MKALKFLKNSAGISMIEVMMAVGVVGGLSLTVAQLMKNTSENTKQNEAKQENVNLKALIQNNLGVPAACFNTFDALITQANLTAMTGTGTVAVPNIKDKVNTIKYSSTTNLHPLTITSMVLTNYVAAAGTADLVINSTFRKSTNVTVMVKPIKIPMNFNINTTVPATPDLISCSSMAMSGGEWMLAGNAGTVDGTDYLGTSDSSPLNFRVNAIPSGRIDMSGATFFGYRSGLNNVAGTVNTSFGYDALTTASSTGDNTAVGASALKTNAQWGNTAVGHEALMVNSTGGNNTAIGRNAQAQSTTGTYNTCVGALCMNNLTTGSYNIGLGVTALWGHNSGKLQGSNNIGIGYNAGSFMSTGEFNILIGSQAGRNMTTGTRNVVIGAESGQGFTTESFKLHIESSGSATPLIGGNFLAGSRMVTIDGKLGVGTLTPGTPSTPVIATAGVTQLHVTGGKTILDQEAWITIPLAAGWASCAWPGAPIASYFKDSVGIVHLKGCLERTGASIFMGGSGGVFTIPVGYRPDTHGTFVGGIHPKGTTGGLCAFYYSAGGSLSLGGIGSAFNTGERCYFTGVSFRADN
jgi:hypothetical protein